jgi:hypothetical protein
MWMSIVHLELQFIQMNWDRHIKDGVLPSESRAQNSGLYPLQGQYHMKISMDPHGLGYSSYQGNSYQTTHTKTTHTRTAHTTDNLYQDNSYQDNNSITSYQDNTSY